MSTPTKVPLGSLPLPLSSHTLTKNLTPDRTAASPKAFRQVQHSQPSTQRRARLLSPETHFSYVAPNPLPFPFKIVPEEGEDVSPANQAELIERWLAAREALQEKDITERSNGLRLHFPAGREQPRELIGLSETGLRDCLPHLDVGDAFDLLGLPRLTKDPTNEEPQETENPARRELIDILSGYATLINVEEDVDKSWAPWSLRYSGHQFGTWAGQLGDGRAISILATPHPSNAELTYELQLKGAGRTPFSRGADGLAVVRSSIREFLCAEAMHALGIPTTRSLSLISLPELPVLRERIERACVLTRVAPSFIRIGSFESLNPPESMFFLGGGQQEKDLEALRILGKWVGRRVLKLEGIKWREEGQAGDAWGRQLVLESARRNAKMVAGWQAYGFMHGVINTDNVSIMGLTIDYGPYAFMDVFNPYHICNHSDGEGRYSYQAQPSVVMYALRSLLTSLSPLIGAENALGNKAVSPGWAKDMSDEQFAEWRKQGNDLVLAELEDTFQDTCAEEYRRLMHKRLGLRRIDLDDESKLIRPLTSLLAEHRLDFHSTFRRLAYFKPSLVDSPASTGNLESSKADFDAFVESLMALTPEPQMVDTFKAKIDWKKWLEKYSERIESEKGLWDADEDVDLQRERAMRDANPRFVLRQWVLEEVIKKVEQDTKSGRRVLGKVLQMACSPFEPWGAEDNLSPTDILDDEVLEERRYCGIGEQQMLGFQCSCSS
ncbi:hypothetical protein BDY19DRAFT_986070 [Irpex rosettiformis]|uniref:Uncharacterized protein n=1 Tax=Irpex rosettiformis TaxID=378272 RepID=A0ACB8TZF6_9APHY|nr:hypothetical protein BDY19DRAFT_986070 [Irpex rosettiformis]